MTEDTSAGAEMPIACCACNHVIRRTDDDTGLGIVTKEWRECASCGQEFISKKIHTATIERLARAEESLFMCAAHCQGGSSEAGYAAANVLGISFPIRMEKLIAKAKERGFDPKKLWPWMREYEGRKA